jgi:hypothetical protein
VTRRVIAALLGAIAVALAGCGGNETDSALRDTAKRLDDVRSGELAVKVGVAPHGQGERFGFELTGPFRFPDGGGTPSANLRYRQTLGGATEEVRVFVDRGEGWLEIDGERRALTRPQLEALAVGGAADSGFFESLDIQDWYIEPVTRDGPDGTLVITGTARAGRALEGLMRLSGDLGGARFELNDQEERRLDRTAQSSRLEIVTGAHDHLLRRLRYELDFGLEVPAKLRTALGDLDGARLTFDLQIRSPNRPVQISG